MVFNVLIASPTDITSERDIAREIILEWNAINARLRKVVLQPIGWETHAHPAMGERAQAILNTQIVNDADLLVAVFWTRIGIDTGVAPGGSVEELRRHMAAGKPAMVYFSDVPASAEQHLDPQFKQVQEFRTELRASQGLIESYKTIEEFTNKFRRQLGTKVNDDPYFAVREDALLVAGIPEIEDTPDLSAEAKALLIAASGDRGGHIIARNTVGDGLKVSTNHQQFVQSGNPRSRAVWENVIDELVSAGLIDQDGPQELYKVTRAGFELADELK
jgi:hypothetical protein